MIDIEEIMQAKNKRVILAGILILAVIIAGIAAYLIWKSENPETGSPVKTPEKTAEEILDSLTAPREGGVAPEEILKSLTAPSSR